MTDPHAAAKDHMHRTCSWRGKRWSGSPMVSPRRMLAGPVAGAGSDLVGLVRHAAATEAGYLGLAFENPFPDPIPGCSGNGEPGADMWTSDRESAEEIAALYRRVWEHSDETINVRGWVHQALSPGGPRTGQP